MKTVEKAIRDEGRVHALQSWRNMFAAGSLKSWIHDEKNLSIDFHLELLIKIVASEREHGVVKILDVGSGPVSMFSKNFRDWNVTVHAADALGDDYASLLDELGIDPERKLVRPVQAESESLSRIVGAGAFDFVVMRNALDHTGDPVASFDQLLKTCSPKGYVLIEHFEHEAKTEKWAGFHQWNMWSEKGSIYIQGKVGSPIDLLKSATVPSRIVNVWRSKRSSGRSWCGALIKRI